MFDIFNDSERQREQVVRLLTGSLLSSVTSVAKDVVTKEAESICNSVNSMLKTLSVQLLQSVDEVSLAFCNTRLFVLLHWFLAVYRSCLVAHNS